MNHLCRIYKVLLTDIKENPRIRKYTMPIGSNTHYLMLMLILPKSICRFNSIDKLVLKYVKNSSGQEQLQLSLRKITK